MRKLLLSFLVIGAVFTSCDKDSDVMEVQAQAELENVIVGDLSDDEFAFEDAADYDLGASTSGKSSYNGWTQFKTRTSGSAGYTQKYFGSRGTYQRDNGKFRKESVLVLSFSNGQLIHYSLRHGEKKYRKIRVRRTVDLRASIVKETGFKYSTRVAGTRYYGNHLRGIINKAISGATNEAASRSLSGRGAPQAGDQDIPAWLGNIIDSNNNRWDDLDETSLILSDYTNTDGNYRSKDGSTDVGFEPAGLTVLHTPTYIIVDGKYVVTSVSTSTNVVLPYYTDGAINGDYATIAEVIAALGVSPATQGTFIPAEIVALVDAGFSQNHGTFHITIVGIETHIVIGKNRNGTFWVNNEDTQVDITFGATFTNALAAALSAAGYNDGQGVVSEFSEGQLADLTEAGYTEAQAIEAGIEPLSNDEGFHVSFITPEGDESYINITKNGNLWDIEDEDGEYVGEFGLTLEGAIAAALLEVNGYFETPADSDSGSGSSGAGVASPIAFAQNRVNQMMAAGFSPNNINIFTRDDVILTYRYINGVDWITISTPSRTGASARSYADERFDEALVYAVSLLSPAEVRRGQNLRIENAGFIADVQGNYSRARTQNQSGFNNPNFEDQYGVTFRFSIGGGYIVNTRPNSLGKERSFTIRQFDQAFAYFQSLETVSAQENLDLVSASIPRIRNAYDSGILEIVYQVNLSTNGGEEFLKVAFHANNVNITVIDGRLTDANGFAGDVYTFRRGNIYGGMNAFDAAFARAKSIKN